MSIAPQLVIAFHAYFPIRSDGILSGLSVCTGPMLVLTTVVRSCFPFGSGKHCFYPPPLALTIFIIPLPQSSQSLVWESVICLSHLGLTTLSFIFCTLTSCESQIYCQRKLLSWGLRDGLIYRYRMASRIILVLCPLSGIKVLDFFRVPMTYLATDSWLL